MSQRFVQTFLLLFLAACTPVLSALRLLGPRVSSKQDYYLK